MLDSVHKELQQAIRTADTTMVIFVRPIGAITRSSPILTDADVCGRVRTCADVCGRVLTCGVTYADVGGMRLSRWPIQVLLMCAAVFFAFSLSSVSRTPTHLHARLLRFRSSRRMLTYADVC